MSTFFDDPDDSKGHFNSGSKASESHVEQEENSFYNKDESDVVFRREEQHVHVEAGVDVNANENMVEVEANVNGVQQQEGEAKEHMQNDFAHFAVQIAPVYSKRYQLQPQQQPQVQERKQTTMHLKMPPPLSNPERKHPQQPPQAPHSHSVLGIAAPAAATPKKQQEHGSTISASASAGIAMAMHAQMSSKSHAQADVSQVQEKPSRLKKRVAFNLNPDNSGDRELTTMTLKQGDDALLYASAAPLVSNPKPMKQMVTLSKGEKAKDREHKDKDKYFLDAEKESDTNANAMSMSMSMSMPMSTIQEEGQEEEQEEFCKHRDRQDSLFQQRQKDDNVNDFDVNVDDDVSESSIDSEDVAEQDERETGAIYTSTSTIDRYSTSTSTGIIDNTRNMAMSVEPKPPPYPLSLSSLSRLSHPSHPSHPERDIAECNDDDSESESDCDSDSSDSDSDTDINSFKPPVSVLVSDTVTISCLEPGLRELESFIRKTDERVPKIEASVLDLRKEAAKDRMQVLVADPIFLLPRLLGLSNRIKCLQKAENAMSCEIEEITEFTDKEDGV